MVGMCYANFFRGLFMSSARVQGPFARLGFLLAIVVIGAGLPGCGGSKKGPKLLRVTGVLTYKGQPVPEARVMFMGDGSSPPSVGVTNEEGKFALSSMTGAGAVPGQHRVAVEKNGESVDPPVFMTMDEAVEAAKKPAPKSSSAASLIPPKYKKP